jgi:MFS family permease
VTSSPPEASRRRLPRTVLVLGFVSLGNDCASEMVTPLLPLFLTTSLGAGAVVVGLVEGAAEATSSLLKLVSGRLADRGWSLVKLVTGGYALSNLARPSIGLAAGWGGVLLLRFLDRVGKGVRTSPRDTLLSTAVSQANRGSAFGFHRAMDHTGAVVGPLMAFLLLGAGASLPRVFLLSALPGALVLLLLAAGLPRGRPAPLAPAPASPALRWRLLDPRVRALLAASGGLALATPPEAFLVLWAHDRGLTVAWVPLLWAAAHAVKALVAAPAGGLSDRLGRERVLLLGWVSRVALLVAFAWAPVDSALTWALFLAHAGALAFTEGAERALVGDFAPAAARATTFGLYHLVCGLLVLPGALLFGVVWQALAPSAAFLLAAGITAGAALALLLLTRSGPASRRDR